MSDLVSRMMEFESGEMSDEDALELFSELVKSGTVQQLQGSYMRTAIALIASGRLTPEGDIAEFPDE